MKKKCPDSFVQKIKSRMKEQKIGIRELARRLGVSHPTVSSFVSHGHQPSFDTCLAIAKWLKQSQVFTLQEVGLLSLGLSDEITFADWKELLSNLSERDRAVLKKTAESMVEFEEE